MPPAPVPENPTLETLTLAAASCQACPLWKTATQTVFGEGSPGADVMLLGEQPGDQEDRQGAPFVGPAGRLLDQALAEAGIQREQAYVTNVVKHFKWRPVGKRRIHQKPNREEIMACRPWLEAELEVVDPSIVVCLGATAAQAILGSRFRVTRDRGQLIEGILGPPVTATVHPSSILRAEDDVARKEAMAGFVADLSKVAGWLDDLRGR